MTMPVIQDETNIAMSQLAAIWWEIKAHLEKVKKQIIEEIDNYPPPIPACDLQFNYLLEERARITQELNRVREASEKVSNDGESVRLIREFIASSPYIDDVLAAKLRSYWQAASLARE